MRIGFVGTHSTGKTTLLNHLKELDQFKDYFINTNISRSLSERGFDINRDSNDSTQIALASININNIINNDKSISDRTLIDMCAYSKYQFNNNKLNEYTYLLIKNLTKIMIDNYYDIVFWIKPEFELVPDNIRDSDPKYRDDIANIIEELINELALNHQYCKLFVLSGSVEQRIKQIHEAIDFVNNYPDIIVSDD